MEGTPRFQQASSNITTTISQKRQAITSSVQRSQTSSTPSRVTKLDQIRASILKNQGGTSILRYRKQQVVETGGAKHL